MTLKEYGVQRERIKEAAQKRLEYGDERQMVAEAVCRALTAK